MGRWLAAVALLACISLATILQPAQADLCPASTDSLLRDLSPAARAPFVQGIHDKTEWLARNEHMACSAVFVSSGGSYDGQHNELWATMAWQSQGLTHQLFWSYDPVAKTTSGPAEVVHPATYGTSFDMGLTRFPDQFASPGEAAGPGSPPASTPA